MKKFRKNKVVKIVRLILKAIVLIMVIGFVIAVCLQRFSDNKISIFNYRMFTVVSGSMSPKYNVGDVLISKVVDPSSVKVGDTISYRGTNGEVKGKVITHQVTAVNVDNSGKYYFRAKGLTNLVEDPIIYEDQLYGVVIHKMLILSLIYKIIGTNIGFYLFIILPLMFIVGSEIVATLIERKEKTMQI